MSSFAVSKKTFEFDPTAGARMLVGRRSFDFPTSTDLPALTTLKRHFDIKFSYILDPMNGNVSTSYDAKFPSDKYDQLSTTPSYTNHRFLGWYTQANNVTNEYAVTSGNQKVSSDNVECSISVLYANWQAATNITLSSQMQDWNPNMNHACYVGQQYGQMPSQQTYLNYRFLGWYTQQRTPDKTTTTSGSHVTSTSIVTYRPTLYALWQLPSDITFDATTNGGTMQQWSYNYYMTQAYGSLPPVDSRQHYYYEGWFTAATGGTKVTTASIVPGDTTLYAQWTASIAITFDATTNGGTMPQDWTSPDYYPGHEYGTLPTPTHPTLNFAGWYLNGVKVIVNNIVPANSVTLVAQYVNSTYELPDLGNNWELNAGLNPDSSLYDGCYQSYSNVHTQHISLPVSRQSWPMSCWEPVRC